VINFHFIEFYGVERMPLNCNWLSPERAKVSPLNPAKINGRDFDRNSGKTCSFEQGSNGRHAVIVDMFVNSDVWGKGRLL
jgi:hypothetical protein